MSRRAALGLLRLLAGCAGTPFRWQDVDRVHDGMTEPQVVAILGPPDSRSQHGNRLALGWAHVNPITTRIRSVGFTLVDGLVVGSQASGRAAAPPPAGAVQRPLGQAR
jgi:hypothetical protein